MNFHSSATRRHSDTNKGRNCLRQSGASLRTLANLGNSASCLAAVLAGAAESLPAAGENLPVAADSLLVAGAENDVT